MSERKMGTCQWCGRHWLPVELVTGVQGEKFWCGWVCEACLEAVREEFINEAMKGKRE